MFAEMLYWFIGFLCADILLDVMSVTIRLLRDYRNGARRNQIRWGRFAVFAVPSVLFAALLGVGLVTLAAWCGAAMAGNPASSTEAVSIWHSIAVVVPGCLATGILAMWYEPYIKCNGYEWVIAA
jgi:hypothetical protein